jgi:hypothetical protein
VPSAAASQNKVNHEQAQRDHDNTNLYAHALMHSQDVQESQSKTHNVMQKFQNASSSTHSTMLIIVICVSFVLLICGVGIARLRNQSTARNLDKHQPCPKVSFFFFDYFNGSFQLQLTIISFPDCQRTTIGLGRFSPHNYNQSNAT